MAKKKKRKAKKKRSRARNRKGSPMKRKSYYLDTSVVRSAGIDLAAIGKILQLTTSALTLIELLNGIEKDDENFSRRRSAIQRVYSCGVSVIWEMPESRMGMTFDFAVEAFNFTEKRIQPLQQILDCLQQHQNRDSFLAAEKKLSLAFPLEVFKEFDEGFSIGFIEEIEKSNGVIKKAFDEVKSGAKKDSIVPPEIISGSFKDFCIWFTKHDVNRAATVHGLAVRFSSLVGTASDVLVGKLHDSYNGSIDCFIDAFSMAAMMNHGDMSRPGKNDGIDIGHFLYLKPDSILVTNDIKMTELAISVGIEVISLNELRQEATRLRSLNTKA